VEENIWIQQRKVPSKLRQALMPVIFICEMFFWILAGALAVVTDVFLWFSSVSPDKCQDDTSVLVWLFPSTSLPIHYSLMVSFSDIESKLLTAL
jgi:hypothetical protein